MGTAIRSVRRRRGLRQRDVAQMAHVSQDLVSLVERGRLEQMGVGSVRKIAAALEIGLPFAPRWRGGELARLLDQEHALLVETLVRLLQRAGWTTLVEYSFNHYGERGSADVVGWHQTHAALLIAEVKSRIVDSQDLHSVLDRKARVVPGLLGRERGWRPRVVGRLVFVAGTRSNRSVVTRHPSTFGTTLPQRGREARRWLRAPQGGLSALWFVAPTTPIRGKHTRGAPERVRRPQASGQASGAGSD